MGAFCFSFNKDIDKQDFTTLETLAKDIRPDLPCTIEKSGDRYSLILEKDKPVETEKKKCTVNDKIVHIIGTYRIDNKDTLQKNTTLPYTTNTLELLAHLFIKQGPDFIKNVIGDFALLIYNETDDEIHLLRDHIGICPLYYSLHENGISCSTDLELLLAMPQVSSKPNEILFARWIVECITPYPPEATYYEHITKVQQAHYIAYKNGKATKIKYWTWESIKEITPSNDEEVFHNVRQLLKEATQCRLAPDPQIVGAHHSGGLDSSSIAVLVNRLLQKEDRVPQLFSWSPPPPQSKDDYLPESEYAITEAVCEQENLPCHYYTIATEDYLRPMYDDFRQYPVTYPMEYGVQRKVKKQGVTQIFSGWGGDEGISFNGRSYFMELFKNRRFSTIIREARASKKEHPPNTFFKFIFFKILKYYVPFSWLNKLRTKYSKKVLDLSSPPLEKIFTHVPNGIVHLSQIEKLIKESYQYDMPYSETNSVRETQINLFEQGHIAKRCETWAARGLRENINYTFPLLDRRLMEFAISLPSHYYFRNGRGRWLFRKALKGILPSSVRWWKTKAEAEIDRAYKAKKDERISKAAYEYLKENNSECHIPLSFIHNGNINDLLKNGTSLDKILGNLSMFQLFNIFAKKPVTKEVLEKISREINSQIQ